MTSGGTGTGSFSEAERVAIDAIFDEHLARGAAPAASWAVLADSELVHAAARGTAQDTAFRVASCTKSFTAAALLSLRDEGLLSLDDPTTRFVSQFNSAGLPSPTSVVPTIRMLMTMSSGLPTDDPWADRQESMSASEFTELLASGVRFESEPGTRFAYSNLGYAMLGRTIEVVTAQPYRDVVEQRLLRPLGLASTGFDVAVAASGGIAVGHRRHAGSWEALPFTGPGAFSSIGGLFSTVSDLARWTLWLAAAFSTTAEQDSDAQVLSPASRREMQQLHRLDQSATSHPTGYGYGLFVEQYSPTSRVISHSGGYPGFSAHMRWSLEHGVGVIASENATYSRVADAATAAFNMLLEQRDSVRTATQPIADARASEVWPGTRAAQSAVNTLLEHWTTDTDTGAAEKALPTAHFSENVELDDPLERRLAAVRRFATDIGGLTAPLASGASAERSEGPAHLVWFVAGATGQLRVEIRMTPEAQPRVQTLLISADRLGR